jgi:hypothetical protein
MIGWGMAYILGKMRLSRKSKSSNRKERKGFSQRAQSVEIKIFRLCELLYNKFSICLKISYLYFSFYGVKWGLCEKKISHKAHKAHKGKRKLCELCVLCGKQKNLCDKNRKMNFYFIPKFFTPHPTGEMPTIFTFYTHQN